MRTIFFFWLFFVVDISCDFTSRRVAHRNRKSGYIPRRTSEECLSAGCFSLISRDYVISRLKTGSYQKLVAQGIEDEQCAFTKYYFSKLCCKQSTQDESETVARQVPVPRDFIRGSKSA